VLKNIFSFSVSFTVIDIQNNSVVTRVVNNAVPFAVVVLLESFQYV